MSIVVQGYSYLYLDLNSSSLNSNIEWIQNFLRYQYVDFIYLNDVSETKIISRTSHHPTGKFMTDVFTDATYICFAVAIVFLYAFIHTWIIYLEPEHKLRKLDFIYFIGNLVNQPFPVHSIKVHRKILRQR